MLPPAENRTDPSPWPSDGEPIVNHGASVFAAHGQSRLVLIRSEPEPPAAGTDGLSVVTCKAHFVDGEVIVSVCEEDPQADTTSAARSVVKIANERDEPVRRTVTTVVDAFNPTLAVEAPSTEQGICRRARPKKPNDVSRPRSVCGRTELF